jgi:hypothetical protein
MSETDRTGDETSDAMRPLTEDFYLCPSTGDLVYRWSDERMVLVSSADANVLRWLKTVVR